MKTLSKIVTTLASVAWYGLMMLVCCLNPIVGLTMLSIGDDDE